MDQKEQLNALCREYFEIPNNGKNDARRMAQEGKIFDLAFRLFDRYKDCISDFWIKDWKHYDPSKIGGNAYAFFESRLKLRKIDAEKADQDGRPERVKEDGKTSVKKVVHLSLDQPVEGDESNVSLLDSREDKHAAQQFEDIEFDEQAYQIVTLILQIIQGPVTRKNNAVRCKYTILFLTDSMVSLTHQYGAPPSYLAHEKELFSVLNLRFLDFFMRNICRTFTEIERSPLKYYGEMVQGRKMEEPKQPLPNDVYVTYLSNIEGYQTSAPAVSMQRSAYNQLMKDCLC